MGKLSYFTNLNSSAIWGMISLKQINHDEPLPRSISWGHFRTSSGGAFSTTRRSTASGQRQHSQRRAKRAGAGLGAEGSGSGRSVVWPGIKVDAGRDVKRKPGVNSKKKGG